MAIQQQDTEIDGVINGRTAIAGVLAFAVFLVSTLVLFLVRSDAATEVRGNPGTTWLSGETKGRLVMAAAGGSRPSVAVEIGVDGDAYDVVDLGQNVLTHNRLTGEIIVLDGVTGTVARTVEATAAVGDDPRSVLVPAGTWAYLVDVANFTAQRVAGDGTLGEVTPIPEGFTDWVGTADGRLWLVNRTDGSYSTFNGTGVDRRRLTSPGADLVLTAVGGDPVVLDRDNSRLRWLRRDQTVQIDAGAEAVLQQPDPTGTCAHVLAGGQLGCYGPDGLKSAMPMTLPAGTWAAAQLFASGKNAVVTWPGRETVVIADWRTEETTEDARPEPSARAAAGWSTVGPLLVNDPGSPYAFTVDRGRLVQLDKFSRLTVLLSADGQTLEGDTASELDADAEVEGVVAEPVENIDTVLNDDGRNDPPRAFPDAAVTRSGRDVIVRVLANDIDPDGDPLVVTSAGPLAAGAGTTTVLGGVEVLYTPPDNFTGDTVFDYSIADPDGLTSSSTVTVTVVGQDFNTAPVAADDEARTQAGIPVDVNVLRNDTDNEGDPLTITEIGPPANGSVAPISSGVLRYTPTAGFTGNDTFSYTIADGFDGEATAIVRVVVTAAGTSNRPPEAVDDRASTSAGNSVSISVLANDTDPDGDPLRVVDVSTTPGVELAIVDGGTITALPAATTSGLLTFTYTVEDTGGLRDTAEVALVVDPAQADRPPKAVDDKATSASVSIPIDLIANDVDPDGDPLLIVSVTQPPATSGSVVKTSPRTVQFTPVRGFIGSAQFQYTISDPFNQTSTATVIVTVIAPRGSGPVARDDSVSVFAGEVATIAPLANDSHPDGVAFGLAGLPVVREGQATLGSNNTIQYTPPLTGGGPFVLTYTIKDEFGRTATASITVTVLVRPPDNRPPTAKDDLAGTTFNNPVTIDVLANDNDADGDAITLDSITQPAAGQASIVGTAVRFTPPAGFEGLASFKYTISDTAGAKSTATVLIQVAPRVLVSPIANPDLVPPPLLTGATTTIRPTDNDIDPDAPNSELRVSYLGSPPGLTTSLGPNGLTVTIKAGGTPGTYTVPYTVVDRDGRTAESAITVIVDYPLNNPPAANPDTFTIFREEMLNVLANDTDIEGGALELVSVSQPASGGSVEKVGQQVRVTPTAGPGASFTFTYTVRDAGLPRKDAVGTVTIIISPCPEPSPSLVNDQFFAPPGGRPIPIDIFANDPSSVGTLVVSPVSAGSLVGGAGKYTYTAPVGFNDNATFSYTVTNVCGVPGTATVTIDVNRRPTANPDLAATARNRDVIVPVLGNDTDPDLPNDALTVVLVPGSASHGKVKLVDGAVEFDPDRRFSGDGSFQYYVQDSGGLASSPVTVTVRVGGNAPPVAGNFAVSTYNDSGVISFNVFQPPTGDPDGDDLTLLPGVAVSGGSGVAVGAGETVTYSPVGLVPGQVVTLTYTVTDGESSTNGTIKVTVDNREPTAGSDTASGMSLSGSINVLANDTDPDGDALTVTGASIDSVRRDDPPPQPTTDPTDTTTAPTDPGDPGVSTSYTPSTVTYSVADPTFVGTIVLSYTIIDGHGGSASGKITINVS